MDPKGKQWRTGHLHANIMVTYLYVSGQENSTTIQPEYALPTECQLMAEKQQRKHSDQRDTVREVCIGAVPARAMGRRQEETCRNSKES